MFAQFEDMFKQKKLNPHSNDYSKTPQKFNINGRQIIEKKLLSQGAFGFIWLAEDINTREQFALKRVICMTQDALKAATIQKEIYQKLPSSPHIVGYYGGKIFSHEGRTVVITLMQLCPNGNLFDMLEKHEGKGLSEEVVKKIAQSILRGLVVLHKAGFIHRDIKIENVLIGKDNTMKICDFGSCTKQIINFQNIPKSDYEIEQQKIYSYTTPMYRPPEIVDPYLKYQVNQKADLWMLGCVLYTMSYFTHPFVQSNAVGIASGVFRFPEHPSQTQYKVSEKMKDYIRNFMTPNPSSRPSAEKMLEIINRWNDFESIPLNGQAKKLKAQHLQKQKEMKQLNKQAVIYDGDIPIQELMKIQQKMKKQTEITQIQGKSFITKQTQKIVTSNNHTKKTKSLQDQVKANKTPARTFSIPQQTAPSPKTPLFDPWGQQANVPKPAQLKKNTLMNFNEFDDFIGFSGKQKSKDQTPSISSKSSVNTNNNFAQFFSQTKIQKQSTTQKNKSPAQSMDLLDL